jgi:hypothetical protein
MCSAYVQYHLLVCHFIFVCIHMSNFNAAIYIVPPIKIILYSLIKLVITYGLNVSKFSPEKTAYV